MTIQAINVRNQFKGKVKTIIEGSVVSEVDVETPAGIVTSVITTRSVKDLGPGYGWMRRAGRRASISTPRSPPHSSRFGWSPVRP